MAKKLFYKKCALNQGEEKLFLEEGAFFIKDKKVTSAKFSVNILRRYVMYAMFHHYTDYLRNSATFARFKNFRNCQLRESKSSYCSVNSIELTTMMCNFAIFISCSNTSSNSRPLLQLVLIENHWSISFDKILFCLI